MQNYNNETMKALTKRLLACKNGSNRGTFMQRYNSSSGGHEQAIDLVYKKFFGESCSVFDCTGEDKPGSHFLDTNLGVDYIVSIKNEYLQGDIDFWVQERFRSEKYQRYQSITLINTQGNGNLAELYKTKAQYLVYGYLSDTTKRLIQCEVIDLAGAVRKIACNTIKFQIVNNNYTGQTFISCDISELKKHGLVFYSYELNKSTEDI